ncbi:hypothetical protein FHG87_013074 [Trinorchestia longiramus]|nr:hypothetical protein FHG87_013074 [Trinorchestia longiramus]
MTNAAWLLLTFSAVVCQFSSPALGFFNFGSSSSKSSSKSSKSTQSRSGSPYEPSYVDVGYGAVDDSTFVGYNSREVDPYEVLGYTEGAYASPGTIESRIFSKGYHKEKGHDDYGHGGYGHDHGGYGHDHGGYGHDDYGKGKGKGGYKSWWKSWTSKGKGYKSKGHKGKKGYGHSYKKGTYKEICYLVPEHDYHDSGYHRK